MGFVSSPLPKLFCLRVPGCQICGPGFRITSCRQDSLLMRWVARLLHRLVGAGSRGLLRRLLALLLWFDLQGLFPCLMRLWHGCTLWGSSSPLATVWLGLLALASSRQMPACPTGSPCCCWRLRWVLGLVCCQGCRGCCSCRRAGHCCQVLCAPTHCSVSPDSDADWLLCSIWSAAR